MRVEEWLGEDNKLGIDIWEKKYRYNNETFDGWLERVSNGDKELRQLITDKKFLFGGRILSNRGLNKYGIKTTLSNCYVIAPPEDNIESIFDCATKLARTFSYGGGCGIDISKLSPRGAKVNNTAKETSGAVSFMDLYSLVTQLIGQNGRRGALMISIDCNHPDLEEFIKLKSDLDKVTKANISIRVTDDFLNAVKNKTKHMLTFTREETGETITKEIDAYTVFNKFAKMNWDYAEPAFLYWDRIDNWNLLSNYENFKYAGVNPCAEEPLPAGGSCLLGSINLAEFVNENKEFNFTDFINTVRISVNALNDVLDEGLDLHPLKEQRESVRDWRQIGLGIFGLADMLIKMGIRYGSQESLNLCEEISFKMIDSAILTSSKLAKSNGTFPKYNYTNTEQSLFYKKNTSQETKDYVKKYGLHNSQLLTIAPTGSLSTMLGLSGGIEPIYANYYERKTESLHGHDQIYKVYTPIVENYMANNNIVDDKCLPDYFITAQTLNYRERIDMQSIWQQHIDASISSTVNVPKEFTVENTEDLYLYAWEKGLKGITIFRDGCKRLGILTTTDDKKDQEVIKTNQEMPRGYIMQIDDYAIGKKRKLITGCGSLHCIAFFDSISGELQETYFSKGSTGGCQNFMVGLSRMISLAARSGCNIYSIVDQLNSCGVCPSYAVRSATKKDTTKGACCPMTIGNALLDMYMETQDELFEKEEDEVINTDKIKIKNPCPECGAELKFEGGCNSCPSCGYSKCE